MKRKLIAFSMTLALMLSVFSTKVGAYTIAIDGSNDWFGVEPDTSGEGMVVRNATQQGVFIYNDAKRDQRLITATSEITREADLDWFSVTGDSSNIYFKARMERYSGVTNNPSVQLLITVDTNATSTSNPGQLTLPGLTGTAPINIPSTAAWEYVVDSTVTRQQVPGVPNTGTVTTRFWKSGSGSSSSCGSCDGRVASAGAFQGSFIEVKVPWSQFTGATGTAPSGKPAPDKPWRFTVSTVYHTHAVPADGNNSALIDAIDTGKTNDASNSPFNAIKTKFDVYFNAAGDVYSPLLISEFYPNPVGQDDPTRSSATDSEWVEIYNPNTFAVDVSNWKIGDAAKRGASGEAMLKFPNNTVVGAGKFLIVARDKTKFTNKFGANPGGVGAATVLGTNQLTSYTAWASGAFDLSNTPSGTATTFEEQVVLLDQSDTIADLVNYATPGATKTPNNEPIPLGAGGQPPEGASFERCPSSVDTDNNARDFFLHDPAAVPASAPTPGAVCAAVSGIDLSIAKSCPINVDPNVANAPIQYLITFSNNGTNPANQVTISDTLPLQQVDFVSQQSSPGVVFDQPNTRWTIASLAPGATGTITINVTIKSGLGPNAPIKNTTGIISSPPEVDAARGDNFFACTTTTLGPADLVINSDFVSPVKITPGSTFEYTISYLNKGQNDAPEATITQILPAGVTVLKSSGDATPQFSGAKTGSVSWKVTSLPVNTSGTIVVTARLAGNVKPNTTLPTTITITTPPGDPTPADNTFNSAANGLQPARAGNVLIYLPLILKTGS